MSTVSLIQSEQSAPADDVPSIGAPQLQHKMLYNLSACRCVAHAGANTCVADCCGTTGLAGKATVVSISIDIATSSGP